ncbi:hypothetical protein V8C86DRAFT_2677294 [Haematococcus lacustris]
MESLSDSPVPAAKQSSCVGLAYYDAWRRTNGLPPVCLGYSESRRTSSETIAGTPLRVSAEFKALCVGFTHWNSSNTSNALPYCEGVELVLESNLASEVNDDGHSASAVSSSSQEAASASTTSADANTTQSGLAWSNTQTAHDETQLQLSDRLWRQAQVNLKRMQMAFSSSGSASEEEQESVHLADVPSRLKKSAQRNVVLVISGAGRAASRVYTHTVGSLASLLGLSDD